MTNAKRYAKLKSAVATLKKTTEGYTPRGVHWREAMGDLNEVIRSLRPPPRPPHSNVPNLGPILRGGKSVLLHDCTHLTSGLGWPAFDDIAPAGRPVLAPESCYVDDDTSGAQGGDAFYITGDSGIRYWVGHISRVPRKGTRFSKGTVMTTVSSDHLHPHVHLALDARKLLGGKHLVSHKNYTHGAPTIGAQLAGA